MKVETKLEEKRLDASPRRNVNPGMKVKSRVKAGVVPDAPDRWKSHIQIVTRSL
jgi:hypothetical protein